MSIEDQKAKIRQVRYNASALISAAGPALAAALLFGGVDKWLAFFVAAAGSITGAVAARKAGSKTGQQRADGMFDSAPEVPDVPVREQAINAVATVVEDAAAKTADLAAVATAVAEKLGIPAMNTAKSIAERVDDAIRQQVTHR